MDPHPYYGIEPEGNAWLVPNPPAVRAPGLGGMRVLNDTLVLELLAWADGPSLAALCVASGSLRCFASFEELWKGVALERAAASGVPLRYSHSSWKATILERERCDVTRRLFSDVLYHPQRLVAAGPLGRSIDASDRGSCARAAAADLTVERFVAEFETAGVPLIIEGGCGVDAAKPLWDRAELLSRFGDRRFHVGGHAFDLRAFLAYASANNDEQPLYLFDSRFGEAAPELLEEYEPACYFGDDLFDLLSEEGAERRPDKRWIIVGGARSGSAWHVDPNGCSAWNATLRGRKRWLFFPPSVTPPGVRRSADGNDLVAPVSLAEWAHGFYAEARAHPRFVEATTGPGDLVFIPRGWWHSVVNLDDYTVALTHNFCSPRGLASTLGLLRRAPHLVAGLAASKDDRLDECDSTKETDRRAAMGTALHARFLRALQRHRPDVLAAAEAQLLRPKSLWDRMTAPHAATGAAARDAGEAPAKKCKTAAFSFNFQ